MNSFISEIETLFNKKIMIYKDIIETLDQEKDILKHSDMVALWQTSAKKHELANQIDSIRIQILEILSNNGIDHNMDKTNFYAINIINLLDKEHRSQLKNVNLTLTVLKKEIQTRARQNKQFVQDYLSFIDDVFHTFTDRKKEDDTYSQHTYSKQTGKKNVFLHKEV